MIIKHKIEYTFQYIKYFDDIVSKMHMFYILRFILMANYFGFLNRIDFII